MTQRSPIDKRNEQLASQALDLLFGRLSYHPRTRKTCQEQFESLIWENRVHLTGRRDFADRICILFYQSMEIYTPESEKMLHDLLLEKENGITRDEMRDMGDQIRYVFNVLIYLNPKKHQALTVKRKKTQEAHEKWSAESLTEFLLGKFPLKHLFQGTQETLVFALEAAAGREGFHIFLKESVERPRLKMAWER